ncbi:MAG: hypothetical protein CVU11_14555 [Bacteroidetes bacterium HGW-Bacteroidetes-6]|nr:MAG: hypothetical protein CVU11_14555 [Bacteroidetes bacterium HGW-Bacteroidetes-6]
MLGVILCQSVRLLPATTRPNLAAQKSNKRSKGSIARAAAIPVSVFQPIFSIGYPLDIPASGLEGRTWKRRVISEFISIELKNIACAFACDIPNDSRLDNIMSIRTLTALRNLVAKNPTSLFLSQKIPVSLCIAI